MPISAIDGCDETHWAQVLEILSDAIKTAGYEANLVSAADDIGVIHKRIIQNLYENPIVVVDVSGKNPNVMLELGLRLAFDKPVVIVKDDITSYSFDTSAIEHLTYPRDLRYPTMINFKADLARKIIGTVKASQNEGYTTFLGHFGQYKAARLETKEISPENFLQEFSELKDEIRALARRTYVADTMENRGQSVYQAALERARRHIGDRSALSEVEQEEIANEVSAQLRRYFPGYPAERRRLMAMRAIASVLAHSKETDQGVFS
ncbi:RNA helicase [Ochrobactrum tritici]|nr:RNA helicase [Brucella tritici]